MTHKTRNLLEAFQASAAAEKQQRPTPRPPGGVEAAAPSSVPAPPAAEKGPPAAPAAPRAPAPARTAWRPSQVHRLAALQALLLVLAFLIGRLTAGGGEAEAAPPASGGGEQAASLAPGGAPAAPQAPRPEPVAVSRTPLTPAEQALDDPANVWTLVLAEYDLGGGEAFARKAYDYLSGLGLPVARTTKDKRMFLVAGAAKERTELDGLLAKVKTLKGPTGAPNEFDTAYLRMIDSVLQRRGRP